MRYIKKIKLYTGKAGKHHIAEHFESGKMPKNCGAAKGSTIFTNYDKMIEYLTLDGRRWYILELELVNEPVLYEFGCDHIATISRDIYGKGGFKYLNLTKI